MDRKITFSGLLSETFALIRDGARGVLFFVFVVGGLGAIGTIMGLVQLDNEFAGVGAGFAITPGMGLAEAAFQILIAVVSVIASYLLLAHFLDRRGLLTDSSTRIWAFVGMGILWLLGLIIGFLLLVVPGIILLVRWSASTGYLIGARKGVVESLSASWNATRGSSWPIFFAGLVVTIGLAIVVGALVGALFFASPLSVTAAVAAPLDALQNSVALAFAIAVYTQVEGSSGEMKEVFS